MARQDWLRTENGGTVWPGRISGRRRIAEAVRSLQDLILQLKLPILAPQVGKLFLLDAGQPCRAAVLVGISLGQPVPQARLANPQILGHRSDPFIAHTGKLDSTLTELRRLWCRHRNILPGDRWSPQARCPGCGGKLTVSDDIGR